MKNFRTMLLPLALIIMVLSLSGSVLAQDMPTYCYDLDEADCALYTDLQMNAELPVSTAFDLQLAGKVGMGAEQMPFAVGVSGAYATDVEAVDAALETFDALTLRDVSLGDVLTLADDVVSAWDAKLSIDLSSIPEMAMLTNGETIDLYLVDGAAYMNSPLLTLMMGDPTLEGVYGIDVFEILDFALSSVTMADIADALDAMAMSMAGTSMTGEDFMQMFEENFAMGFEQGMMGAGVFTEADAASFVSLVRLADGEANGETIYVFETTIDVPAIFSASAMRDQMAAILEQQLQAEMMDMDINTLMDALATSMTDSTMVITEKYGATSNVVVGADVLMKIVIDINALSTAMGEPASEESQLVTMQFTVNYMLEDINQVDAIDLPADAQIVPLMDMLGGGI